MTSYVLHKFTSSSNQYGIDWLGFMEIFTSMIKRKRGFPASGGRDTEKIWKKGTGSIYCFTGLPKYGNAPRKPIFEAFGVLDRRDKITKQSHNNLLISFRDWPWPFPWIDNLVRRRSNHKTMNLPQPVFSEATYNTINPYDIDATAERMHVINRLFLKLFSLQSLGMSLSLERRYFFKLAFLTRLVLIKCTW